MESVYLFDLASRRVQYLTVRQAVIAGNIANANTPGYRAADIEPFAQVLEKTNLAMTSTKRGHLGIDGSQAQSAKVKKAGNWDVLHSGNSVSLDQQMLKAGEVSRDFSLTTGVIQAFERMLGASIKSGS